MEWWARHRARIRATVSFAHPTGWLAIRQKATES
jgi:hypothetical protein